MMLGQLELKYCAYYWMCIRQSRPDTYRFACGPPCSVLVWWAESVGTDLYPSPNMALHQANAMRHHRA